MEITKLNDNEYDVNSTSEKFPDRKYRVTIGEKNDCSCPSYIHGKKDSCKHIEGVLEEYGQGEVVVKSDEPTKKSPFKLNPEHIIDYKGKDFILYKGLLEAGQHKGIKSLDASEILQYPSDENKNTCIVKAVLISKDGERYSEIGDASFDIPHNVNNMIKPHFIRMAATRAKARALRDFTGIAITSFEELGADTDPNDSNKSNGNGNYSPQMIDAKAVSLKRSIIKQLIKLQIIADCRCKTPKECDHDKKKENDNLAAYNWEQLQDLLNMFDNNEIKNSIEYKAKLEKL